MTENERVEQVDWDKVGPGLLEALKEIDKRLSGELHYIQKGVIKIALDAINKAEERG